MHLAQINEIEKQNLMYTLVKNTSFMYNEYEKGAIRIANGSPQLNVTYQKSKSNLTLVGAVAFLIPTFLAKMLYNAYRCDNYANNCHNNFNNTNNHYHRFSHRILYLSLHFPYVSPPQYWKFSK